MADSGKVSTRRHTKGRVLQARIPEHLDEELRERAGRLGLSVSTLVRNTLLHTFDLVEGVVADSAQLARAAQGRGKAVLAPELPTPQPAEPGKQVEVIGWQEATLNRNGVCDKCNAILAAGDRAAIGIPIQARPILLCPACLSGLSTATVAATSTGSNTKKPPTAKTRRKMKPAR
jgi:hypothetical protein